MAPERVKLQRDTRPQPSARHIFSIVVEKRKIDMTMLDEQQRSVLDNALSGESLFITGAGG